MSAILDLYDRRIVLLFVISDRNDNALVMDTFDSAVAKEPDAHRHSNQTAVSRYECHVFDASEKH